MLEIKTIGLQGLIDKIKHDDVYERLLVVLLARETLGWKYTLPKYLLEAKPGFVLIEAAERWLSVYDNISLIRPYIKQHVYYLDGGVSIKTRGASWECIPLSITTINGEPTLNPHTTDVYEWLNDNVYMYSDKQRVLDIRDCINYGTPNRGK